MDNEQLAALERAARESVERAETFYMRPATSRLYVELLYLYRAGKLVPIDDGAVARATAAEAENAQLREALKPFAKCSEQIADDEDDEEWAKFRLLIKDYRRAARAIEAQQDKEPT